MNIDRLNIKNRLREWLNVFLNINIENIFSSIYIRIFVEVIYVVFWGINLKYADTSVVKENKKGFIKRSLE